MKLLIGWIIAIALTVGFVWLSMYSQAAQDGPTDAERQALNALSESVIAMNTEQASQIVHLYGSDGNER